MTSKHIHLQTTPQRRTDDLLDMRTGVCLSWVSSVHQTRNCQQKRELRETLKSRSKELNWNQDGFRQNLPPTHTKRMFINLFDSHGDCCWLFASMTAMTKYHQMLDSKEVTWFLKLPCLSCQASIMRLLTYWTSRWKTETRLVNRLQKWKPER